MPPPPPPRAVYGLDFSSAPGPKKPLTLAVCGLADGVLRLEALEALIDFAAFAAFLERPGPWACGMDFPFGLPRQVVAALDWPSDWPAYVARAAALGMEGFVNAMLAYKADKPCGAKEPKRAGDTLAGASSPIKTGYPPVGRMFVRGAALLAASGVDVVPCRRTVADRLALEAYPALVARTVVGRRPYKGGRPWQRAEREGTRTELVEGLPGAAARVYGLDLRLPRDLSARMVTDAGADWLDALLCAVQAGWAVGREDLGVADAADPEEGWIVDPACL